ncbi:hypothetical protein [Frigoribacterium sp. PhB118]|uniref:hypothetical protein n=1 Tax=Frigoribacterium sp. PhB118 TaxID=2485175 RepID=UPI000F490BDF|nr:hypothetical protein [Frigoribacterium sp. PhB118]ROS52459.1 hypothetical protein EDF21_2334 [Frigoribacterium sp. PhB118]
MNEIPESTVLLELLRRFGWQRTGQFRDAIAYWAPADAVVEDEQIMLPLIARAPDFDRLLARAQQQLRDRYGADFEQSVELVELMLDRKLDEIDIRKETDNSAGLIRWEVGNRMIDSARGLLGAAAKASNSPKRRFAQSQATVAEQFLQSCYMGQTRIGSYIVTALVPALDSFATSRSETFKAHAPHLTGSQITATLVDALGAVKDAVHETQDGDKEFNAFEERIPAGVSYEFLASLQFLTEGQESGIVVDYNQFDGNSLSEKVIPRVEFDFSPEEGLVIASARRHFAAAPQSVHASVTGEVTLLKNAESTAEHQIRVQTRINGRPRTVIVNMTPDQYDRAVAAHGRKVMLTVVGELERRQRGSVIEQPDVVTVTDVPVGTEDPTVDLKLWDDEAGVD